MAEVIVKPVYELRLGGSQWERLAAHLFPGDLDEHGAIILAGVARTKTATTLIAREVITARDGIDYVPGRFGYRMLTADFVREMSDRAAAETLAYIAVHCHGGSSSVGLSQEDRRSQQRGYPALLDILDGSPVMGAVFATAAAAGDVWLPDGSIHALDRVVITGNTRMVLTPSREQGRHSDALYDRQALLFGEAGQNILRETTVAIIGCGGIGFVLVELLARLGVGHLILVDDDIVEPSNLPRLVGATRRDAAEWLTRDDRPTWMRTIGKRLARAKVNVARRIAKQANPTCRVTTIRDDVSRDEVAQNLKSADYLFLAADTYRARLVVNAVAFQYSIPGVQLGAKVRISASDGAVTDVFSVVRPFGPEIGCLWCNNLIPPGRLADEAVSEHQRHAQRYVDDASVRVPSVITLNSVAASHAANEFMFHITGLPRSHDGIDYVRFLPATGEVERTTPRRDPTCPECGDLPSSRRGYGDGRDLPTKVA
jgi:molybdopterin/thiamine biosynthesis adenylyltransferase